MPPRTFSDSSSTNRTLAPLTRFIRYAKSGNVLPVSLVTTCLALTSNTCLFSVSIRKPVPIGFQDPLCRCSIDTTDFSHNWLKNVVCSLGKAREGQSESDRAKHISRRAGTHICSSPFAVTVNRFSSATQRPELSWIPRTPGRGPSGDSTRTDCSRVRVSARRNISYP
jgi:hypothetical protein